MIRFEFDNQGYVCCVLYGCTTGSCVEYTGLVPSEPEQYADIDDWADRAQVQAYYLNEKGNLTYDANRAESLPDEDDIAPYKSEQVRKMGIIDAIYPIGSLYLSVNDIDPSTLFGGTWVRIEDRFLLASGSSYPAGTTGGSATHKHLAPVGARASNTAATIHSKFGHESGQSLSGNKAAFSASNNSTSYSDMAIPYTSEAESLPPYLAIYVWQRVEDPIPDGYAAFIDSEGNAFIDANSNEFMVREE